MTADGLTDLINHTTLFRDEKREAEQRIATAKANASNTQAIQRANKKKNAKKKQVAVSPLFSCVRCLGTSLLVQDYYPARTCLISTPEPQDEAKIVVSCVFLREKTASRTGYRKMQESAQDFHL